MTIKGEHSYYDGHHCKSVLNPKSLSVLKLILSCKRGIGNVLLLTYEMFRT